MRVTPRYIQPADGGLRCDLCPHRCLIADGRSGFCGVRTNSGGKPDLPYAGLLSTAALDPIEKKPLYHYHPGEMIYSIGFYGCNLRCPFCQNYAISQEFIHGGERRSPEETAAEAAGSGSFGIAYTYSEPLVHFEFLMETAALARERGLKNILVSNGFLNPEPAAEILSLMDAANIDLKSFSDDFYRRTLKGSLAPVLDFIRLAARKTHLEVTTLVIPGQNDSVREIGEIARFLAGLDPEIPLHMSCYVPRYKYRVRATTGSDLLPLLHEARRHLVYVYPGNIAGDADTRCPRCGALLIRRSGYRVEIVHEAGGFCGNCGKEIPLRRE